MVYEYFSSNVNLRKTNHWTYMALQKRSFASTGFTKNLFQNKLFYSIRIYWEENNNDSKKKKKKNKEKKVDVPFTQRHTCKNFKIKYLQPTES